MNELEKTAYGRMAQALAWHAHYSAENNGFKFPGVTEPVYDHISDSTFEAVAVSLWKLRILKPLDEEGGWAHHFIMDCKPDDACHIAMSNWKHGPNFDELLITLITLFGDYGTEYWGFSTQRDVPFGKDGRLTSVLDALVPLGYLHKSEPGYIWTERVVPLMYAAGYEEEADEVDTLKLCP